MQEYIKENRQNCNPTLLHSFCASTKCAVMKASLYPFLHVTAFAPENFQHFTPFWCTGNWKIRFLSLGEGMISALHGCKRTTKVVSSVLKRVQDFFQSVFYGSQVIPFQHLNFRAFLTHSSDLHANSLLHTNCNYRGISRSTSFVSHTCHTALLYMYTHSLTIDTDSMCKPRVVLIVSVCVFLRIRISYWHRSESSAQACLTCLLIRVCMRRLHPPRSDSRPSTYWTRRAIVYSSMPLRVALTRDGQSCISSLKSFLIVCLRVSVRLYLHYQDRQSCSSLLTQDWIVCMCVCLCLRILYLHRLEECSSASYRVLLTGELSGYAHTHANIIWYIIWPTVPIA